MISFNYKNTQFIFFNDFSESLLSVIIYFVFIFGFIYYVHFIVIPFIFISVLIHEMGHYIAYCYYGYTVKRINIGLLRNYTYAIVDESKLTKKQNRRISIAGPIIGISPIIFLIPLTILYMNIITVTIIFFIFFINIANFIPIKGSDGYYIINANKI